MSATDLQRRIDDFLASGPWAVVGASTDRAKYGNKVLRCYLQKEKLPVWPVHPKEREIEGLQAFPDLASLPATPRAISIITPPKVTAAVVDEAARLGIRHVWMQPGAEGPEALERAAAAGIEPIAGGPCLLVVLGFRE